MHTSRSSTQRVAGSVESRVSVVSRSSLNSFTIHANTAHTHTHTASVRGNDFPLTLLTGRLYVQHSVGQTTPHPAAQFSLLPYTLCRRGGGQSNGRGLRGRLLTYQSRTLLTFQPVVVVVGGRCTCCPLTRRTVCVCVCGRKVISLCNSKTHSTSCRENFISCDPNFTTKFCKSITE